jgi:hypothetical protein
MALVTVAQLKSTMGLGSLYSDADLQNICDSAEAIVLSYLPHNTQLVIAKEATGTTGTIYTLDPHHLVVGETINVENVGAHYNGSATISAVTTYSISFVDAQLTTQTKRTVVPYGKVTGPENSTWEDYDAINMAALLIAVDIFQAKTAPSGGATAIDFQPSPYKMGMSLLSRVKGLLAPYMAVGGMIG